MTGADDRQENGPDRRLVKEPREDPAALPAKPGRARALGVALLVVSVALFVAVPVVPFFPLPIGWKVGAGAVLVVVGEAAFWVGSLLLGQEVVRRYRRFFDPRDWFGKKRR